MASDSTPPSVPGDNRPEVQQDLPDSFGRFRITRLLGQGGMGLVYLANDPKRARSIALKVLAREKADNETLLKRFRSEALATRELKHENIVGVYEAGSIDGQFYIALEFVEGTDVSQLIRTRGRLPVGRSLDITRQVALALSVAYRRNIVHRDIKPSNLLIRGDGVVKLTDMGLARSMDDAEQAGITRAGTTVGTVDYISPEQARNSKSADTRSDIYSLGCTWYHMLTGEVPFPHGSLTDKLQAHANTPAPDPRNINSTIPEEVVLVLQRMLEKSPDRRHPTPDDLVSALETIVLNRTEITTDDIAALADADAETIPHTSPTAPPRRERKVAKHAGNSATQKPSPRPAAPPPSPRSRRNTFQPDHQTNNNQGIDLHKIKSIGLFLLAATILGILGYVFATLGQSIDVSIKPRGTPLTPPPNTTSSYRSHPFAAAAANASIDSAHTPET
ncbi:MAG: serine/threonine-protein kinase [Planctomycetota bacterium]|nr:serine/threonine-protein kinase [Planctomycetota bacterium]